jgi:hypothetical protein
MILLYRTNSIAELSFLANMSLTAKCPLSGVERTLRLPAKCPQMIQSGAALRLAAPENLDSFPDEVIRIDNQVLEGRGKVV